MAIHERVWERDAPSQRPMQQEAWKPVGTHALLGIIAAIFVLQQASLWHSQLLHNWTFAIGPDWFLRPWTLITSTLAHDPWQFSHILFNGLVFFFFAPALERVWGTKKLLIWFFVGGAISGIIQVSISGTLALGASGAINLVMGALTVLMPKHKILIWGILPMPFWAATAAFAFFDFIGAIGPANGVGNIAHLAGLAIGLWLGWKTKQTLAQPRW